MATYGSDPEFFIYNPKTDKFVSAIGVINGTKEAKIDLGGGHEAFYDNVLGECNIKPASSKKEFIENIKDCLSRYSKLVNPYLLVPIASHTFPVSELKHPDSMAFGCSPSYCAYTVSQSSSPVCEPGNGFRSGGGHIHMGGDFYPINDDWGRIWLTRMLDLFVCIPSLFIDDNEESRARRKLYGSPGDHRVTNDRLEYRSLSNFWLASPKLVSLIHDLCEFAIDICIHGQHEDIFHSYEKEDQFDIGQMANIQKCIISGNKDNAKKYMEICQKLMPESLWRNVVEYTKPHDFDFYKEWDLD